MKTASVNEVAKALKTSARQVRRMIDRGDLVDAGRDGRTRLVTAASFQRMKRKNFKRREVVYITVGKRTKSLAQWARDTGQTLAGISYRYRQGWEPERIVAPRRGDE